ncbi:hypothetical protein [Streptomyces sp. BRA346]|uniref:hypothetical protein n=1 Tax=Streptomyces sp. BRA346 TaxID=2878199 RepID=UPI004064821E
MTAHWSAARQTAWQRALTGTGHHQRVLTAPGAVTLRINTDGCVYRARRALYGAAWEQAELRLQGLGAKVVTEVTHDRAFRAAQRAWASCMRDNGDDVTSLQQARGLIQDAVTRAGRARPALQRVGDRELRLSGHDAACQRKTDLAAAVRTAQKRVEARLPASSWKVVTTVKELRGQALRKGKGRT